MYGTLKYLHAISRCCVDHSQVSFPGRGLQYHPRTNLCYVDSLVQLVARVVPEFLNLLESSPNSAVLQSFKQVAEAVQQPEGSSVQLEPLGESIVGDADNEFSRNSMGCSIELWRWITKPFSPNDLSFLHVEETSIYSCLKCRTTYSGVDHSEDMILGFEDLRVNERLITISRLFQKACELETINDFHCKNSDCEVFRQREAIKSLPDEARDGREQERLDQMTGTRQILVSQSSSVLFVRIHRWRNHTRSSRHILLEADKHQTVAGMEYELVGIQNHEGSTLNSGHWETLVKDHESSWWKFSGENIERVPLGLVSSKLAVNLVYRKL